MRWLAVVLFLVVGVCVWILQALLREAANNRNLVRGLRADVNRLAKQVADDAAASRSTGQAFAQHLMSVEQRLTGAHNNAAVALDRLMFYTRNSAILDRLGSKYDREIARIKAQAAGQTVEPPAAPETEAAAEPAAATGDAGAPDEQDDQDAAPEGMAQVAGSIGAPSA